MEERRKERLDRGIKVTTEGIYAISSWQEMGYLLLPRLVLICGILVLPLVLPIYWQRVISIVCIYSLLALGFTIPIATIAGGAICTLLLYPCLPLRGVYFAIVTLMYPLVLARIIEALNVLGGTDGIVGVASFPNRWVEQYGILLIVIVSLFGLRRLVNEDIGLVFRGVKDNDQAVKASALNINFYKSIAVFIASAIGCLGGAYLSHIYMWSGISQFALDFSIIPIAATVIGGGGTLVGPILGCFILVPINELLRAFGTLRIVIYCLILVAFIIYRSEGIMVYAERKYHQFERWVKV
jgi:branched-chain amino acid transport system permease protein